MTTNFNEIFLRPPGGVAVNQWKDGSLHFRCGPAGYLPLAELFAVLAVQCKTYAEAYKTQTVDMTFQQTAPPAAAADERVAELQREIARLQGVGMPVSVNTNPAMTAAQQLAAVVAPHLPQVVPAPTLLEVAAAMSSRNVQHPVAAAASRAVHSPIIPPARVPPQPFIHPHIGVQDTAHQNPGPAQLTPLMARLNPKQARVQQLEKELAALREPTPEVSVDTNLIHKPILHPPSTGTPAPDAPNTIVTGGPEVDDGTLSPSEV